MTELNKLFQATWKLNNLFLPPADEKGERNEAPTNQDDVHRPNLSVIRFLERELFMSFEDVYKKQYFLLGNFLWRSFISFLPLKSRKDSLRAGACLWENFYSRSTQTLLPSRKGEIFFAPWKIKHISSYFFSRYCQTINSNRAVSRALPSIIWRIGNSLHSINHFSKGKEESEINKSIRHSIKKLVE